ncbi:hypothetical protein [Corynebacterium sp. sy039]|uniref:VG15 protein n=1 Tax=Corynebacterium sp. sy039 TaxID=2599641 RepID=UPI0011B37864|nr:hypothetical protein [Corynebacterium sp. sy039]QDZ42215.1 hypothetical protein FQV43_02815 [Corynebacterium sp. sy039]
MMSCLNLAYPEVADPVGYEQAVASYRWGMRVDDTGDGVQVAVALRKLQGVVNRLVVAPARRTVELGVARAGTWYARVPEPGACDFCLMLASRGGVYSSETVFGQLGGYHDNCRCVGIEVADDEQLPRINRELRDVWRVSGSRTLRDFGLALNTRREFTGSDNPLNRRVYRLVDDSVRAAVERWQGMDRFYEEVQDVVEDKSSDSEAVSVAQDLIRSAHQTPLQSDVLMWRGVRNWHTTFGTDDLDNLPGWEDEQERFTPITSSREVATNEFTTYGKAGALLRVEAKKGTPGIWMPTNGSDDEELVMQQEFLVPPVLL